MSHLIYQPVLHSISYAGAWPGQALLRVEDFLEKAAELGYRSVALVGKRPHVSPLDFDGPARRALRARMENLGLELAAIMGYSDFSAGLDRPGIPSAEMNAAYIGSVAQLASDLGASRVRIFTGYRRQGIGHDAQMGELVKGLRLAARQAARCGVVLMVQNHHDLACHHDEFAWLLDEVGEPNVKAAFDAWAPHLQGVRGDELAGAVEKVGARIAFTTVADYEIHRRFRYDPGHINFVPEEPPVVRAVAPGRGEIDYESFFRGLRASGYTGPVAYEMCAPLAGGGSLDNLDATARSFLSFLDRFERMAAEESSDSASIGAVPAV